MSLPPAKIVGVAIRYANKTYTLPAPNRHHDVIRSIPGGVYVEPNGPCNKWSDAKYRPDWSAA